MLRKRSGQAPATQTSESTPNHDVEPEPISTSGHVDLFADHADKQKKVKPMDEEKRLEQEKYEKQIGYLTYLGQDTHESLGTQSWYNTVLKRDSKNQLDENGEKIEVGLKVKHLHDPMLQFLKKPFTVEKPKLSDKNEPANSEIKPLLIPETVIVSERSKKRKRSTSPEKKHKKSKSHKKSKDKMKKHKKEKRKRKHSTSNSDNESDQLRQIKQQNLQKLREQRLQRERQEQNKTKEFLRKQFPSLLPPEEVKKPEETNTEPRMPPMKQKYNSQFNPFLAKQNYSN